MKTSREVGCPCTTYFKANVDEWVREFRAGVAHVPDDVAAHVLSTGASTMDRPLRGVKREKPGSTRRNRRPGRNEDLLMAVECRSGEVVMGCDVPPGDVQADTVAHCGGDMGGSFRWTLTATDRRTQWTELRSTWNRGVYTTRDALDAALRRRKEKANGVELYHRILKRLRRIRRLQDAPADSSPAPSGKCPLFDERNESINPQRVSVLFDELGKKVLTYHKAGQSLDPCHNLPLEIMSYFLLTSN